MDVPKALTIAGAGSLADMPVATETDMEEAARRILGLGPKNVLVKGGHLAGAATDILWNGRELTRFTTPRIDSTSTHGTGCTFSSRRARRRDPRGQGLRDRRDPRGLPAGARRGRAPSLRGELVEADGGRRRPEDVVHGAPGRAARAHHARALRAPRRHGDRAALPPAARRLAGAAGDEPQVLARLHRARG